MRGRGFPRRRRCRLLGMTRIFVIASQCKTRNARPPLTRRVPSRDHAWQSAFPFMNSHNPRHNIICFFIICQEKIMRFHKFLLTIIYIHDMVSARPAAGPEIDKNPRTHRPAKFRQKSPNPPAGEISTKILEKKEFDENRRILEHPRNSSNIPGSRRKRPTKNVSTKRLEQPTQGGNPQ